MTVILYKTPTTPDPYRIEDLGTRDFVGTEFPLVLSDHIPEAEIRGSEDLAEDIVNGIITATDGYGNDLSGGGVQVLRFALNGKYWQQPLAQPFDGPGLALLSGYISRVAVAQSQVSASGSGYVEVDVLVNGTSIWSATPAPVLSETVASLSVQTQAGDLRSVSESDSIAVAFSAKSDPSGDPRDISIEIEIRS